MTTEVPRRNDGDAWEGYWRRVVSGSAAPPPWHFSSAEEMAPYVLTNLDYEQLGATEIAGARRLHARLGGVNLHLRGVLHAMTAADWPAALTTLAVLAGKGGRVFDVDVMWRRL